MGFYQDRIIPHIINLSMRNRELTPYRQRVIGAAEGRVLEIGIGSGLNLPLYTSAVNEVVALEPASRLIRMAQNTSSKTSIKVTFIEGTSEAIPLTDKSIDAVVMTWVLCSIPNAQQALAEMRRVLKPDGQLLFVEHGRAPETSVSQWQDRLNPTWRRFAGGCNLNRPIATLIEDAGFHLSRLETGYMKGPRLMTFISEGRACPV
jgi:ubiquinone/menaquinone biosynthesis C-methylase UbiE